MNVFAQRFRPICAAALMASLGACSSKRIASIDGVRSVKAHGGTMLVDLDVREPVSADDTSIALGQAIAAIADRMKHRLPPDMAPSTTSVLITANYVVPGRISADAFAPGQTARISVPALRAAARTDLTPQSALDLIQATSFASVTASSDARIFCEDPAHLAASPTYCAMIRDGADGADETFGR